MKDGNMSVKKTKAALEKAQKTYDLHDSVKSRNPMVNTTWLVEWYWKQRLMIAEKIGRKNKMIPE